MTGKIPRTEREVTSYRHVWHYQLHNIFFDGVVAELVEKFNDLVCKVCKQSHSTVSNLIDCLRYHKRYTVDYFMIHELIGSKR